MSADDLVVLLSVTSEFHAESIVAALADMDIEAVAFGAATGGIGMPLSPKGLSVPVQVRAADLDRARAALEQIRAGALEIDWDQVDLGEPETRAAARVAAEPAAPPRAGMPVFAKFAFSVAVILALIAAAAAGYVVIFG